MIHILKYNNLYIVFIILIIIMVKQNKILNIRSSISVFSNTRNKLDDIRHEHKFKSYEQTVVYLISLNKK